MPDTNDRQQDERAGNRARSEEETKRRQDRKGDDEDPDRDRVEEASWESFPASDPPAFNPGGA